MGPRWEVGVGVGVALVSTGYGKETDGGWRSVQRLAVLCENHPRTEAKTYFNVNSINMVVRRPVQQKERV